MTTTSTVENPLFKQKRIDNMQWAGVSGLSSLSTNDKFIKAKIPLFYLDAISIDNYDSDVYFVNNTDEILSFVAPYQLMATDADCPDIIVPAKPSALDTALTYTQILPYQGVRIARQHMIYDSDYLNQFIINTISRGNKETWGVWRFNVVEKGLINKPCPLLWQDTSKPASLTSAENLVDPKDRPILPLVLPIREALYEQWCKTYDSHRAHFMMAVTDVIYRYDFGVVGCYYNDMWDEFSAEAEHIAEVLIRKDASSSDNVLAIMTAVYDASFGEKVSKIPLVVAEQIYCLWIQHKRWVA